MKPLITFFAAFICLTTFVACVHAQETLEDMQDIPYSSMYSDGPNDGWMATPTCETYPEWMGMHIDDVDLSALGDRPHRVLKPDSMATMDYSPDRLNIHTTDEGVIIQQDCG